MKGAFTGAVSVVASWPRPGAAFDRFFLVPDRDGELLVAASSTSAKKHVIVRVDTTSGSLKAVRIGSGDLLSPPVVDPAGYLVVIHDKKSERIVPERFTCDEMFATVGVVPAPGAKLVYTIAPVRLDALGPGLPPD